MTLVSALCAGMLAGCGGGSSASTGSTGDSGSNASGDAYNVTVIVKHTDGHFNKVIAGARAYGSEHDNVNVEIQSPTSATSYDEQVNMIETALGNPGIDAVVIAPQQSTSTATLVDTATRHSARTSRRRLSLQAYRATRPMKHVCAATAMRSKPQAVRCSKCSTPTPCRTRQQPLWRRLSRSTRTA